MQDGDDTIHNLKFQGTYGIWMTMRRCDRTSGLSILHQTNWKHTEMRNLLKGGIVYAD